MFINRESVAIILLKNKSHSKFLSNINDGLRDLSKI